jgi:hypothetical protein
MNRISARRLLLSAGVVALGLGGLIAQARASEGDDSDSRSADGPVGSWSVTDPTNPHFHALATYGDDGTFTVSAGNAAMSGGHGVWKKTGPGTFELSFFIYHFNAAGIPDRLLRVHENATLDKDRDEFDGAGTTSVCDVDGKNCTLETDVRHGTRIKLDSAP